MATVCWVAVLIAGLKGQTTRVQRQEEGSVKLTTQQGTVTHLTAKEEISQMKKLVKEKPVENVRGIRSLQSARTLFKTTVKGKGFSMA